VTRFASRVAPAHRGILLTATTVQYVVQYLLLSSSFVAYLDPCQATTMTARSAQLHKLLPPPSPPQSLSSTRRRSTALAGVCVSFRFPFHAAALLLSNPASPPISIPLHIGPSPSLLFTSICAMQPLLNGGREGNENRRWGGQRMGLCTVIFPHSETCRFSAQRGYLLRQKPLTYSSAAP
jgi:hypothetical protein